MSVVAVAGRPNGRGVAKSKAPASGAVDVPDEPASSGVDRGLALPTIGVHEIFAAATQLVPVLPRLQVCVGRPTIVYALPGVGKSIVIGSAVIAAAAGVEWLGGDAIEPTSVLWADGEVGPPLTLSRKQRLATAMGVGPRELGDRLRLAIYPALCLDAANAEAVLTATCAGYTLVVIDSLTALSGSADETTPEMGRIMLMLARVSGRTGAAIIVIHHARRDGEIRGSSSIAAGSENIWRMTSRGRDIVLRQERSPIGALRPDLTLRIRDVAIEGDPLAGLAVELVADVALTAKSRTIETEILDHLATGPHTGGAQSLALAIERNAALVRKTVEQLVKDKRIIRTGASQSTRLEIGGRR